MPFRFAAYVALIVLASCGGEDVAAEADAADSQGDANSGLADAGAGACSGACAEMSLTATFGATVRTFDRAFFGLTAPGQAASGDWEIYIENGAGDDDQCPTMKSPTPRFLLIIAGLALPPAQPTPVSGEVNLVDFAGELLPDSVLAKATSNTVSWVAADPCIACAEGSEADRADRMIAVDIDATFEAGSVSGHSFATHCDSLDTL